MFWHFGIDTSIVGLGYVIQEWPSWSAGWTPLPAYTVPMPLLPYDRGHHYGGYLGQQSGVARDPFEDLERGRFEAISV